MSAGRAAGPRVQVDGNASAGHGNHHSVSLDVDERECDLNLGQEDAMVAGGEPTLPRMLVEQETSSDDDDQSRTPKLTIPFFTEGLCTIAYEMALRNRIQNDKLRPHGIYDLSRFKPVFVHDVLMQPGSLANVTSSHESPLKYVSRMTPALMTGFHAYVHSETQQPCLMQSPNSTDHVLGMLLLGEGKEGRKRIHEHYRRKTRRITVPVEIDVFIPMVANEGSMPTLRWQFKRRTIQAYAWIWANVGGGEAHFHSAAPRWTLEGYLSGEYSPQQQIDIRDADDWPDAEVGVEGTAEDWKKERREVVYGGGGHLDYERADCWTGW
jgi:hypothetical protein